MKKMYPKTENTGMRYSNSMNIVVRFAASLLLMACTLGATAQNAKFEWVKKMGGPNWDWSQSLATDKDGNVFVTGNYDGTADFNTSAGTITITSAGAGDAFLAKYAPNGNCLWAKTIGGDMNEQASMVTVDGKGNVYVTGNFYSTNFKAAGSTTTYADAGNGDAYLVKYDGEGNYRWTKTMSGGDNETGYGLAVDDKYNVYISGNFGSSNMAVSGGTGTFASAGQGDIFIAKYDSAGNYRWAKTIGGTDNDENRGIAIGHNGAIYLGGFINGTADMDAGTGTAPLSALGVSDAFIAKYDSNFNYRWAKRMGSFSDDYGLGIALDSRENVYTTGYISGIATFDGTTTQITPLGTHDILIAKYDSAGNYGWATAMGAANAYDESNSITVDAASNVYITGSFDAATDFNPGTGTAILTPAGGSDIFLAKYDANGNYRWAKNMGGTAYEQGYGVGADRGGNIYVTGRFFDQVDFNIGGTGGSLTPNSADGFLVKYACGDTTSSILAPVTACSEYILNGIVYTTSGTHIQKIPNAAGCDSSITFTLTLDPIVKPLITVNRFELGTTMLYASYQWFKDGTAISTATGATYTVTANGDYRVAVTNSNGCSDTSDVKTITNVGVANLNSAIEHIVVYPNPTSDLLNISSPIAVNTTLYSIEGRVANHTINAHTISLEGLTEGIYMLYITDSENNLIRIVKAVKQSK